MEKKPKTKKTQLRRKSPSKDAQIWGFSESKPNGKKADLQDAGTWQRPNWKNRALYPDNDESLSDDEWRWEFLRRNENYQRDYINRPSRFAFDYGLLDWISPAQKAVPKFVSGGGHVIELAKEPVEQFLQYQSWVTSLPTGRFFMFMIDVEHSLKSQIKIIENEYDYRTTRYFCCKEKKINSQRKNNKMSSKTRPRSYLLRILDATASDATPNEIGSQFSIEGQEAVGENSIRKAISFAQDFWKRF